MSSIPLNAPVDMVMPATAQLWMHILNGSVVLILLLLSLREWRRRGSDIGIWLLLGGALTALNEPIVDVLGKCWFPALGSWTMIKAWGVSIPSYMIAVYAWYVGGQAFIAFRLYTRGLTRRQVFKLYAVFAVVNVALEMPGLNLPMPMYSYYGYQPFVVAKFPLWWTFCNALMPMVMGAVAFRLEPLLSGLRRLLLIPMAWMAAGATNALVAAPTWLSLNVEQSSPLLTHAAALVSLGMGLMVCAGVGLATATDAPSLARAAR